MSLKIGICGKREIAENEKERLAKEIEESIKNILDRNNSNEFIGYTALAIGADTIFAEVVSKKFKQPLQIVLPFPLDEYRKDFTDTFSAENLENFTNKNYNSTIVSNCIPADKTERTKAYFATGKYLVDTCDEIIFVWDGLKPKGMGGTAEIIGYYSEKRKKEHVSYIHVHTGKEDILDKQIMIEFKSSNAKALINRNRYKKIWRSAILFGWLVVLLFSINTSFKLEDRNELISVTIELLLVIYIYYKIQKAKQKNYHGKYLTERMRAETFRILRHFYHAGMEVKFSAISKEDTILVDIAKQINKSIQHSQYKSKWYGNYTIKDLIHKQQKYHEKKIKLIGNKALYFEKIKDRIAVAFLISVVVHFVNTAFKPFPDQTELIKEISIFFNILLPASYAAIEGILYFQEWELLKKYSEATHTSLKKNIKELPIMIAQEKEEDEDEDDDDSCFRKQVRVLNTIGNTMLTDNKNWKLILEEKNKYQFVI